MVRSNPDEERLRLVALYSSMSDGELVKLARSGGELTPIAQEIFSAEIKSRGLDITADAERILEPEEIEVVVPEPPEERTRIAAVYSAMSDEELAEVAGSGDELTIAAHEALLAEASKRGLTMTIAPPRGQDVIELNETVTIRKFRDLPDALLAKGSLESAGIHAYLVDDNMIRMDWFISNLLGGIKLKVHSEDVEAANEILSQPIPEVVDVEGIGEYEQPRCPKCHSLEVSFRELNKLFSYGSAYVGVPIPIHKKAWICHGCGHEWEEEDAGHPETESSASQ